MPGGRPSNFREEYCDKVIEYGKLGMSRVEMAANLKCGYDTFLLWQEKNPKFLASVNEAVRLSQAWWESKGRDATFGGVQGFNATSFIFNMKNRFKDDWKDKQEVEQSGPGGGAIPVNVKVTFGK